MRIGTLAGESASHCSANVRGTLGRGTHVAVTQRAGPSALSRPIRSTGWLPPLTKLTKPGSTHFCCSNRNVSIVRPEPPRVTPGSGLNATAASGIRRGPQSLQSSPKRQRASSNVMPPGPSSAQVPSLLLAHSLLHRHTPEVTASGGGGGFMRGLTTRPAKVLRRAMAAVAIERWMGIVMLRGKSVLASTCRLIRYGLRALDSRSDAALNSTGSEIA